MYFNLLKSDLFRARRMKCSYILTVIFLALSLLSGFVLLKFNVLAMGMDPEMFEELSEAQNDVESFEAGFEVGLSTGTETPEMDINGLIGEGVYYFDSVDELFVPMVAEQNAILLLSIFVALFIGDIYVMGLDKNIISANKKRCSTVLSRFSVIAIYSFFTHVLTYLFTILAAAIMADRVWFEPGIDVVLYFIVSWMLSCAFCFVVAAIATVTRSKVASVVIGVLMSAGFLSLFISIVDHLIVSGIGLDSEFMLSNFTILNNLSKLSPGCDSELLVRSVVLAVIYSGISLFVSCLVTKKRDIS